MADFALPYPDMDFVPLDILPASEMNKIVANINSLAQSLNELPYASGNFLDTPNAIGVRAMTPTKSGGGIGEISGNNIVLPPGMYIIFARVRLTTNTSLVQIETRNGNNRIGLTFGQGGVAAYRSIETTVIDSFSSALNLNFYVDSNLSTTVVASNSAGEGWRAVKIR